MKYFVKFSCVTLNFLVLANVVSSTVYIVPKYDDATLSTKKYDIKQKLVLSCNVTSDDNKKTYEVVWEKDGKLVSKIDSIQSRIRMKTDGSVSILTVVGALESDGGNYSCAVQTEEETQRAYILAASNIYVKTPGHINVVEAEKLRIHCVVHGHPLPEISWIVHGNETYEESRGRVKLLPDPERKMPNAIFVIEDIQLSDRGVYTCKGYSNATKETLSHDTMVRIKDKYAALWPFLGIVVEVLVLCIIILVYEKKRNKTEMEESDTDQSPEQKNTPDHDGKESNLRHRQ